MLVGPRKKWILTLAILSACIPTNRVLADALVVTRAMEASTIAEVSVDERQVRVELEIGAADVKAFRNILPDELFEKLIDETVPLDVRLKTFLKDDWRILADDRQLAGRIENLEPAKRIVRDEITGDPLPIQPDDAEIVIRVALAYDLGDQPASLTIRPPLDRQSGAVAANMGFVVYHQGVAVNDFRYLSGEESLQLDWDDPWYSAFERKTLGRRYFAPAAAFIYVENFEVRKEIIFRPKDLQHWVELGLDGESTIAAHKRDEICERAAEFLDQHTPVEIDGTPAIGTLDRVHFIQRTLRSSGIVEPDKDIDVKSALIGAIYVYPIPALPEKVTMAWDLFNDRIARVPATASDEAGGLPSYLEPEDHLLVWQNYLTNPTLPAFMTVPTPRRPLQIPIPTAALLCLFAAGLLWIRRLRTDPAERTPGVRTVVLSVLLIVCAVLVTPWTTFSVAAPTSGQDDVADEEVATITNSLLHNVYRAFDYRDESTIYDVLDRSVAGELLNRLYLETRRSLTLASQGGARVKVRAVELVDCNSKAVDDGDGFVATCTWNVTGSVGHWGHLHQRQNQYRAEFEIRPLDGQWKIQGMQLLGEERLF